MITLITGGARSGKTRHALMNAGSKEPKTYIATAELLDDEMRRRAARHRMERGASWETIEEPYELSERLARLQGIIVIDCLTLWLSNWLLRDEDQIGNQIDLLCGALRVTQSEVVAITNEVGWAIVPDNALARRFRDYSGMVNQRVAEVADRVFMMVCGIPFKVK
jgi:adenosylcobinamide kinase/adenosylcobinamide-phosphate guanylyltransferase